MSISGNFARCLFTASLTFSLICTCAITASPARAAPVLGMHRAPHPPAPSTLPPPKFVGDQATRLSRSYNGTPIDVTTYHYDLARTGWNQSETDLTPASVASSQFGLLATLKVDGNVLAQPLVVSNYVMPDHTVHNVLIIVTGHDSVYAFDAQTYAILWQVSLGTPESSSDVGCGDVIPEYGISSTPVVLRNAGKATMYVVAATEPSSGQFVTTLHALDLGTGLDLATAPPATIAPSATLSDGSTVTYDAKNQWSRAGLAMNNGYLYVGISSHCDHNANGITGWMLRYTNKLALQGAFHTVNTQGGTELASIWMTGFAPAIDASGFVFAVTGNGDFTRGKKDWGESVLKLKPGLGGVSTSFTASAYSSMNASDDDLGSGGVMLIPPVSGQTAPPLAVTMGKTNILYLLNQNSLGGLKPNDAGALQSQSGGGGVWGGPAFYNGADGPIVFTQGNNGTLRGWSVATGATPSLSLALKGTSAGGGLADQPRAGAVFNRGLRRTCVGGANFQRADR